MKLAVLAVVVAMLGCKASTPTCADAIGRGIDQLSARRRQLMTERADKMPAAAKAEAEAQLKTMETIYGKLKVTMIDRCTEDKWPAEVLECYADAMTPEQMRSCRIRLPRDQADRVHAEEVTVMKGVTEGSGSAAR